MQRVAVARRRMVYAPECGARARAGTPLRCPAVGAAQGPGHHDAHLMPSQLDLHGDRVQQDRDGLLHWPRDGRRQLPRPCALLSGRVVVHQILSTRRLRLRSTKQVKSVT